MNRNHRIFTTSFASVYPLYVAKAERKGRTRAEVDTVSPKCVRSSVAGRSNRA
jgi:hypothetical protein